MNSPAMTDEMREKIAGTYRAPVRDWPLADRLLGVIWRGSLILVLTAVLKWPLWIPLIPVGLALAEAIRNGRAREGAERWFWKGATVLSFLWVFYCIVFWPLGEAGR